MTAHGMRWLGRPGACASPHCLALALRRAELHRWPSCTTRPGFIRSDENNKFEQARRKRIVNAIVGAQFASLTCEIRIKGNQMPLGYLRSGGVILLET